MYGVLGQGGEVAGGEGGEEYAVGKDAQVGVGQRDLAGGADYEEGPGGGEGLGGGAVGGKAVLGSVDERREVGVDDVDAAAQIA
ncbi:hypothetical protein [Streptomyces sp. x-45]|uniref:hypothetical protein n=1 Tax=Streptomyces sp. x-45 TaxID=2789281 RepID=UPI00397FB028